MDAEEKRVRRRGRTRRTIRSVRGASLPSRSPPVFQFRSRLESRWTPSVVHSQSEWGIREINLRAISEHPSQSMVRTAGVTERVTFDQCFTSPRNSGTESTSRCHDTKLELSATVAVLRDTPPCVTSRGVTHSLCRSWVLRCERS